MNPESFIRESIDEIWNRKQIGRIYDAYQHNAVLHSSDGDLYSREAILRDTTWRLAALPNAQVEIEDLIACGDQVSLRWSLSGCNSGHSIYGPPTGQELSIRNLSWYQLRDGRIVEEWRAIDEMGLILGMGLDAKAIAGKLAVTPLSEIPPAYGIGEIERVGGQTTPEPLAPTPPGPFNVEEFIRRNLHRILNWRLLGEVDALCDEDFLMRGPAGRELQGSAAFQACLLATLGTFPDMMLCLEDLIWEGDDKAGYSVATRWTALGTHEGPGVYGEPTGKRVRLTGISHYRIRNSRLVEVWSEHDEFAILKQLYVPPEETELTVDESKESNED